MNKKSLVMMLVTICLIGVVGVGATMAYLSDTTDQLTNTFTLGKVDITLEEPGFDEVAGEDKTIEDLVPGQTIAKDPTVTVAANSVDSYVFMSVKKVDAIYGLGFEIAYTNANGETVDGINSAWKKADGLDTIDGIYVYVDAEGKPAVVKKSTDATTLPALFTKVIYSNTENDTLNKNNEGATFDILVKAAAVQAGGEITYDAALAEVSTELTKFN